MRSLSMLIQCTFALFLTLNILKLVNSAPYPYDETNISSSGLSNTRYENNVFGHAVSSRQANEEEDSNEDSIEDDGEDDAEQAQQSLIDYQNQQNLESVEGSDEEGSEDDTIDDIRRHRRDTNKVDKVEIETPATEMIETNDMNQDKGNEEKQQVSNTSVQPSTTSETTSNPPSFNQTSVLILIHDTLKKVTAVLPTEQVTTNALQYFQLFEHFLQETIQRVIDDYDDDDEETTTTIKIDEVLHPVKEENINYPETNSDSEDKVSVESTNDTTTKEPQKISMETNPSESLAVHKNAT